eukprot:COSAG02_NODE_7167_length_3141_cov_3.358317_3_plen_137_part_00
MFPPGREVLLQDKTVAEALRQVVAEAWTEEARKHAEEALLGMSDKQPGLDHGQHDHAQKHIMISCEYTSKPLVIRSCPDYGVVRRSVVGAGDSQAHRERAAGAGLPDVVWCAQHQPPALSDRVVDLSSQFDPCACS